MKRSRNAPCPCGSGKKYKHCCERKAEASSARTSTPGVAANATPTAADFDPLLALFNTRRYEELENQARALLQRHPHAPFAWQLLGGALQMQGKDALAAFQKVASLSPNEANAHFNLGVAFKSAGQPEQAAASYRRALALKPDYVEALGNLANVLQDLGRLDEAVWCYQQAMVIQPNVPDTHNSLGIALKDLGRLDEAVACYRRAIGLKPDFSDAYYNLGNVLKELGQLNEAVDCYRRALRFKPDATLVLSNLGSVLKELGKLDEALLFLQRAIEIDPLFDEVHSNMGFVLQALGRADKALQCYQKALAIKPESLQYAIQTHMLLPVIPASIESIAEWRERFRNGISSILNTPNIVGKPLNASSFYLAYHNSNDRPLMEGLCQLYRARVPQLNFVAPHIAAWRTPDSRGQRLKVGFLSEFFYEHTIGKHYKGFIGHLDRNHFEVVVIHAPKSKQDVFHKHLDEMADKSLTLPAYLIEQQQVVASEQLDVLFYPDIGMSSTTYFLAYARLAPVQATSWGHPDTTGLDSMDYYVAAISNETEHAQDYYSERLIRLNRLPCYYYHSPDLSTQRLTKAELNLPTSGTLYGCPQNLFKIHPEFDGVLAKIAEEDANGYIVLPEGKYPTWTELIKARWARTFPVLLGRVIFMPRMNWNEFMAVLSHMDVLLDPIHFGSGNTFYDAMIFGTPVVTWPGQFGRGRNVAAAYQQMGITDAPTVYRIEDYAPLALALGRDTLRRDALRDESLVAARRSLFEDMQAVREFESFLGAAVAAAGKGTKLARGWRAGS